MKRTLVAALGLVVLAGAGFGAYRLGWIGRFSGITTPEGSATTAPTPGSPSTGGALGSTRAPDSTPQDLLGSALRAAGLTPSAPAASQPVAAVGTGEAARILSAFRDLSHVSDRSSFDVAARAAALGADPLAAFAFVRDRVANEVYPGVLRGAAGTLSAGAGNDLDKAVLLGSLLAAGQHKVRYPSCELGTAEAERRVQAMFAAPPAGSQSPSMNPALKAALVRAGLSEARSEEVVAARDRLLSWLGDVSLQTAATDVGILREAMAQAGIEPHLPATGSSLTDEARTHYWVQVESGGTWQDLDAAFPDATPGRSFCSPAETYSELPDGLYQAVSITVRNEYLQGQTLASKTVLTDRFRTSDEYGQLLLFVNVGVDRQSDSDPLDLFVPTLRRRNHTVAGDMFATGATGASGTADMFGSLLGEPARPQVLAQWIDFTFEAPGRPRSVSRALTDLVEPRERSSGEIATRPDPKAVAASLAQTSAIAVSAGLIQPAAAFETVYAPLNVEAAGRVFDRPLDAAPDEAFENDLAEISDSILAAYAPSYASAAERQLARLSSAGGNRLRLVRDQPMLTVTNYTVRPRQTGKGVVASLSLDLRHNVVRVATAGPESMEQAFWANVEHGLVDGALERHLPGMALSSTSTPASPPQHFDTSTAMELARSRGVPIRAVRGAAAVSLLQHDLAQAGGYRIAREVGDGAAIITPTRPLPFLDEERLGVWAVDLTTGHVLPLLDTGLRQGMVSRALTEAKLLVLRVTQSSIRACVSAGGQRTCSTIFRFWTRVANSVLRDLGTTGQVTASSDGSISVLVGLF